MTFDDLTPWDINKLVHTRVMGEEMEWCRQYLFTNLGEDMCQCRGCQRIGTFEQLTLLHEKPVPNYSENMTDAWEALVYRHGRLNYAGDTTPTQLQILLEDMVGTDWRDILEDMNAYVLCQVMLQAVKVIDVQGNVLVDLNKGV